MAALLLAWFLFVGTGAAEYCHNLEHAREDAIAEAGHADDQSPAAPIHDDTNCPTHAQLHQPILIIAVALVLALIGLFVAFVIPLATSLLSQRTPLRIACRGPPLFALILTRAASR